MPLRFLILFKNFLIKRHLLSFLETKLKLQNVIVLRIDGHILITPIIIFENWKVLVDVFKSFTIGQLTNTDDNEYLFSLRKWFKRNTSLVNTSISTFEVSNGLLDKISFNIKQIPKRL